MDAGADYYGFLPVYVINILNFDMDETKENPAVKTTYRLYEEQNHSLLTDKVTFIFIELGKFKKTIEELDGNILDGMYFCFKNMSILKERPDALEHDVFRKIFRISELYNMDEDTRSKVLEKMTTERDLRNQMAYAKQMAIEEGLAEGLAEGRAKGLAEGLAEGRAEGLAEGRAKGIIDGERAKALEIAVKLIATGMTKAEAAAFVGISVEDIDSAV